MDEIQAGLRYTFQVSQHLKPTTFLDIIRPNCSDSPGIISRTSMHSFLKIGIMAACMHHEFIT